jgi:hypothetical protein
MLKMPLQSAELARYTKSPSITSILAPNLERLLPVAQTSPTVQSQHNTQSEPTNSRQLLIPFSVEESQFNEKWQICLLSLASPTEVTQCKFCHVHSQSEYMVEYLQRQQAASHVFIGKSPLCSTSFLTNCNSPVAAISQMTMSLRLLSQFKILFRKKDFSDNTN